MLESYDALFSDNSRPSSDMDKCCCGRTCARAFVLVSERLYHVEEKLLDGSLVASLLLVVRPGAPFVASDRS